MVGAGVTTQLLKPLLATQRDYPVWHFMGPEAYPSGHTTAAMSFALALVIVSSPRWRPLAAAAGGLLTVGDGLLAARARLALPERRRGRPARGDRLGVPLDRGAAPRAAPERGADRRWPPRSSAAAGALAVLLRPVEAFDYAVANTTFVAGALDALRRRAGAQR